MPKKKIIYTYTDRLDRKQKSPTSIFPRKIHGDTSSDSYEANSSINMRNEFSQQLLDQNLNKNVISDLGNDFIINDIKTSKDNEYYFYGAKKTVNLKFGFFSGTNNNMSGTVTEVENYGVDVGGGIWATPISLAVTEAGEVYVAGFDPETINDRRFFLRRSSFSGEPFGTIYRQSTPTVSSSVYTANAVAISPIDGAVYVAGYEAIGGGVLKRSPSGLSGTFVDVFNPAPTQILGMFSVAVSPIDGAVYVTGLASGLAGGAQHWATYRSPSGLSGTFIGVDVISGSDSPGSDISYRKFYCNFTN